jgi:non-specific protein-tyrosine kinase
MAPSLVTLTDPGAPAAEAYRRLRVNLAAAGRERPLRTLLVASAGDDPEKALTPANLAVAFARVGQRVILADCDLRHPEQHALFGLANAAGVSDVLADGDAPLPLASTGVDGLRLLASGPPPGAPADAVASPAMRDLIRRLAEQADVVILDAPPVTLATDAAELSTMVDGVLLTVAAGRTRRDDARRAKELLDQVGARIVGAALVNVPTTAEQKKYLAA